MKRKASIWFKQLPVLIRDCAIAELSNPDGIKPTMHHLPPDDDVMYSDLSDALMFSFIWRRSELGYDFWEGVNRDISNTQ